VNRTLGYLGVDTPEQVAASWEKYKGFTVRPVKSTEQYYANFVRQRISKSNLCLVYGGTPEIRSPLRRAGIPALLVDRSARMVQSLGLLAHGGCAISTTERFVEADWRELPLPSGSVNFALGDDAINMVPWKSFRSFLRETHRVLTPGGLFACHLLIAPDKRYRRQSAPEVVQQFQNGIITSIYDYASRINFTYYDDRTFRMGWQHSIAGLRALLESGTIKTDFGFINRFSACNSRFACPPGNLWEQLATEFFSIEDIFYPKEHDYCRFEPLYLLKQKESKTCRNH
jgi:SAM-dependent methyltransferase